MILAARVPISVCESIDKHYKDIFVHTLVCCVCQKEEIEQEKEEDIWF